MAALRPAASPAASAASPAATQPRQHRLRLHPPPGSQQQQLIVRSVYGGPMMSAALVRDTARAAERPRAAAADADAARALRDPLSRWQHDRSGRNEWGCSFAASVAERLLWLGVCCPCDAYRGPAISTLPGTATWPRIVSYITQITRALTTRYECGVTSARVLEFGRAFCCCCLTVLSCCADVAAPPPIWLSAPPVTDEPAAREGGVGSAGAVVGRAAAVDNDGEVDRAKLQALQHGCIADVEKELAVEPPTALACAIGRRVGDALWRWGTMVTATDTELKARRRDPAAIAYRQRLQALRRLTSWARGSRGNLLTAKDVAPIVARVWCAMCLVDGAATVPLEVQQLQDLIAELSDRVMAPSCEAGTATAEEPSAEAGTAVVEETKYREFKEWVSSVVDAADYASDYASVREAEALRTLQDLWDTAEDERAAAAEQDVDADGEELLQSLSDEGVSDEEESDVGQQSDAEEDLRDTAEDEWAAAAEQDVGQDVEQDGEQDVDANGEEPLQFPSDEGVSDQEESDVGQQSDGVEEQEESDADDVEAGEQEEEATGILMHFARSGATNAAERVARDQGHQDQHVQQQEEEQQQEQEEEQEDVDEEVELDDEEAQQAIDNELESSDEEEDVNELESSDEEDVGVASAKQRVRTWREQVKELRALPLALQAVQASALGSWAEYPLRRQHDDEQWVAAAAQRRSADQAQEQAESERRAELEAARAKASRARHQAVQRLQLGGDFTNDDDREECLEGLDNLRPDEAEEDVVEGGNWETITWGVDLVWHSLETGELQPLKRRVPPSAERGAGPKWKRRAYRVPSQVADAAGEAVARASAERATQRGWWGERSVAL